jgi:hypothetical protein
MPVFRSPTGRNYRRPDLLDKCRTLMKRWSRFRCTGPRRRGRVESSIMTDIDNPFDGEAARIVREQGATEQIARDFVVLRHLLSGDTRALAFWLERDFCPGEPIRRLLAYMLQPVREDTEDPTKTFTCSPDLVPFELVAKRRRKQKGRHRNPVADERNTAIKEMYERAYEGIDAGGHESAIKELAEQLGPDIKESAIREAVKKRSPKSVRGKK